MSKPQFSKYLFWDCRQEDLDFEKHARYIIDKVVSRGTLEDWYKLKDYYGVDKIKEEVVQCRYLDKKTLGFLSNLFDIPREKFRCYILRQSNPQPWIF